MKRLVARAVILAGLIGITIGLGALTWATFSVLFVPVFLCAAPANQPRRRWPGPPCRANKGAGMARHSPSTTHVGAVDA